MMPVPRRWNMFVFVNQQRSSKSTLSSRLSQCCGRLLLYRLCCCVVLCVAITCEGTYAYGMTLQHAAEQARQQAFHSNPYCSYCCSSTIKWQVAHEHAAVAAVHRCVAVQCSLFGSTRCTAVKHAKVCMHPIWRCNMQQKPGSESFTGKWQVVHEHTAVATVLQNQV